ncbi:MAG: hypothetical protein HMLKMBBP_00596 [Planctomycetes bacterium]|nr:hypothetical protein [Planctomycetota bacterium]
MAANFCEACGHPLSPAARFCGGCGAPVPGGATAAAAGSHGERRGPGSAHPDPDVDAASARDPFPTSRGPGHPGPAPAEETVVEFRTLIVSSALRLLLCVLTLGLAWPVLRIRQFGLGYLITTQRLEIRSGLFTVRRRSIDLYRVQDIEVTEPFFLRLRGAGDVRVLAMDKAEPEIVIEAAPDVRSLHATLRQLVQNERRRMNVRLIEES